MSTIKANAWLNLDGTENYKCRAWVNFNGTGTVAIRAAGNVSSITDNGVGDYTVNFTTALPDVNYSVVSSAAYVAGTGVPFVVINSNSTGPSAPTTTSTRLCTVFSNSTNVDSTFVTVSVFR